MRTSPIGTIGVWTADAIPDPATAPAGQPPTPSDSIDPSLPGLLRSGWSGDASSDVQQRIVALRQKIWQLLASPSTSMASA